ncbi:MAG: hypothetical protein ACLFVB_09830 [Thermoplasmata archaeon]
MTLKKCPDCKTEKDVIKHGLRETKKGTIQRYYCKSCNTSFSGSKTPRTEYPENVILYTLDQYNRGYPVKVAKKRTGRKYQYSPPRSTIYTWIDRYKDTLTFLKLRKNYNIDPENLTTTHNYHHRQVYPFTYHHLKLNIHSKQRPELRRYINWIERSLDRDMFLKGPRCSSTEIDQDPKIEEKDNLTTELTQLAFNSQPKNSNKSPHETVEEFFLINDSTTVCTELPVFINPSGTSLDVDEPITGHIDLIQIRYDNLYILDYKPNLNYPEKHTSQLQLYKKAIQKRTSI